MSRDLRSERLAAAPLFAHCSPDELRAIARALDVIDVRSGTVLSSPDHRPNPLVMLLEGEAVSLHEGGVTGFLDGTLHGAAEELAGLPRREQIVASTDAVVVVLDPRRLVPLLADCPNLALALMRQLAREGAAA